MVGFYTVMGFIMLVCVGVFVMMVGAALDSDKSLKVFRGTLRRGDMVRVTGSRNIHRIEEINGNSVTLEYGDTKFEVHISKLYPLWTD